jgi:carboxymethylenebutenolidase
VPPLEYIDPDAIKAPLMGHFAIDDVPFPIASVDKLEQKLRAAKVAFEFHRYPAMHGFANETQVGANRLPITEYQPEAAALAWQRTLKFFGDHLR